MTAAAATAGGSTLHRLDFSWLVGNRVLWHTTIWVLCLAGLTISASGTVIGWRRLRRKVHQGTTMS